MITKIASTLLHIKHAKLSQSNAMKKLIVKKRKYYTEGLPPLQWMRQSRRERKLLPVPPHPPYIKVSQLYVSLLNPHLVRVELHGP